MVGTRRAAEGGHASVTEQLIEARCNVNLQANSGFSADKKSEVNPYTFW
jgi:hypothetical protein